MIRIFEAIDRTWPAASHRRAGGWLVRQGLGGGRRVSAASAADGSAADTIREAEDAHAAFGQAAVFQIRPGQDDLDVALASQGYRLAERVTLLAAPITRLTTTPAERMTSFPIWPPLAIANDVWAEGNIGAARRAVMDRASVAKIAILGRVEDRAAGSVYVALDGDMAMVHALYTLPALRRKSLARNLMRAAAAWAEAQGANQMALAVEDANTPALALYQTLGMETVGSYHYRVK